MFRQIVRLVAIIALVAIASMARAARAQNVINILTGGTAGVYYPVGIALAKLYSDKIPLRSAAQATNGSVENLNLVQRGLGEVAFSLGDSLAQAWNGNEDMGFRTKLDRLRTLAAVYPNYIQLVASRQSGIRKLFDLKGKRMSVGAPRSGTELNTRAILTAAGLTYEDLNSVEYLPFAESVELMKQGQIDVTLQSAGLGVSSIRDLAANMDVVLIEIPSAIIAKIGPPFDECVLPAGTYPSQASAVATACIQNYLVTRADLPEPLVYQMTKVLFENLADLVAAHPAAAAIRLAHAPQVPVVPLHPGAKRYYREQGVPF